MTPLKLGNATSKFLGINVKPQAVKGEKEPINYGTFSALLELIQRDVKFSYKKGALVIAVCRHIVVPSHSVKKLEASARNNNVPQRNFSSTFAKDMGVPTIEEIPLEEYNKSEILVRM